MISVEWLREIAPPSFKSLQKHISFIFTESHGEKVGFKQGFYRSQSTLECRYTNTSSPLWGFFFVSVKTPQKKESLLVEVIDSLAASENIMSLFPSLLLHENKKKNLQELWMSSW